MLTWHSISFWTIEKANLYLLLPTWEVTREGFQNVLSLLGNEGKLLAPPLTSYNLPS